MLFCSYVDYRHLRVRKSNITASVLGAYAGATHLSLPQVLSRPTALLSLQLRPVTSYFYLYLALAIEHLPLHKASVAWLEHRYGVKGADVVTTRVSHDLHGTHID